MMDSDMKMLRRKVMQQLNREIKNEKPKSASYKAGYIDALARVVHLIDKINMDKQNDDYDQHRFTGLTEEE